MANNGTAKALRENVTTLIGKKITNAETFEEAVPLILTCQARIMHLKDNLKGFIEDVEKLGDMCREYAFDHPSVQTNYDMHPDGVESVDVEAKGNAYHVAYCFGKFKRTENGKKIDQQFLTTLPEGWAKEKLELVDSAVTKAWTENKDAVEAEGLVRTRKTAWSLRYNGNLCEGCML